MPKAVRKAAPSAATVDAAADAWKDGAPPGIIVVPATKFRLAMGLWHKRLNMISGTMALSYKQTGLKRDVLRGWIKELRLLADAMEKHL